jgi:hypothetical protein
METHRKRFSLLRDAVTLLLDPTFAAVSYYFAGRTLRGDLSSEVSALDAVFHTALQDSRSSLQPIASVLTNDEAVQRLPPEARA